MSVHRVLSGLVLTVSALSPACSIETADEQLVDEEISVPMDSMGGPSDPTDYPPGSGNGFDPLCMKSALKALRKYGVQPLWNSPMSPTTYGTLPPNPDLNALPAACRQKVLKYAMRCALPKDTFAIDPFDGGRYWGWLNMTPVWRSSTIAADEQWWFTACMYQHLNGFGVEVPILLDGNLSPKLYPPTQNHPTFAKRDSRIWGNLFTATGDFYPSVCYETDLLNSCEEFPAVDTRLCDSDPSLNCQLAILGPCSTVCTPTSQGPYCGNGGFKNIGSRLKDFTMYGTMCVP